MSKTKNTHTARLNEKSLHAKRTLLKSSKHHQLDINQHYYNCKFLLKLHHISSYFTVHFKTGTLNLAFGMSCLWVCDVTCMAVSMLITVAFDSVHHSSFTVTTNFLTETRTLVCKISDAGASTLQHQYLLILREYKFIKLCYK